MSDVSSLCIVCAWRKDCQKRFLKRQDIEFRCPDFTKDMSIKDTEKTEKDDGKKESSGHN